MAVQSNVSFSQSPDGKLLTLIDDSDYTSGNINAYTRKVQLWSGINGSGSLIDEVDFIGTSLEADYEIESDRYFSAKLIFSGSPAVSPAFANFTTQQFEQNALNDLLKKNCGCIKGACDKQFQGFLYMYSSQVATLSGNSGLANSFIDASYKLLTR